MLSVSSSWLIGYRLISLQNDLSDEGHDKPAQYTWRKKEQNSVHTWVDTEQPLPLQTPLKLYKKQLIKGERKEMEKWKREEEGGTQLMEGMECTYHDDSTWLLCCAHAHDGSHANSGALEIHPAEGEK